MNITSNSKEDDSEGAGGSLLGDHKEVTAAQILKVSEVGNNRNYCSTLSLYNYLCFIPASVHLPQTYEG